MVSGEFGSNWLNLVKNLKIGLVLVKRIRLKIADKAMENRFGLEHNNCLNGARNLLPP